MSRDDAVTKVGPADRMPADPTPGMVREEAIAAGELWSGLVVTDPHMTSGWHHHGDHETSIYLVDGEMRVEFGPGGGDAVDARAGDFVHVPPQAVHRERNPGDTPSRAVVSRAGSGPVTVNVDGPA